MLAVGLWPLCSWRPSPRSASVAHGGKGWQSELDKALQKAWADLAYRLPKDKTVNVAVLPFGDTKLYEQSEPDRKPSGWKPPERFLKADHFVVGRMSVTQTTVDFTLKLLEKTSRVHVAIVSLDRTLFRDPSLLMYVAARERAERSRKRGGHQAEVSHLALRLGLEVGLRATEMVRLDVADIGLRKLATARLLVRHGTARVASPASWPSEPTWRSTSEPSSPTCGPSSSAATTQGRSSSATPASP